MNALLGLYTALRAGQEVVDEVVWTVGLLPQEDVNALKTLSEEIDVICEVIVDSVSEHDIKNLEKSN